MSYPEKTNIIDGLAHHALQMAWALWNELDEECFCTSEDIRAFAIEIFKAQVATRSKEILLLPATLQPPDGRKDAMN